MLELERSSKNKNSKRISGFPKLLFLTCVMGMSSVLFSQKVDKSTNKSSTQDHRIVLNKTIDKNTKLQPFTDLRKIYGLTLTGDIALYSDSSLVRVILVDNQFNEYLIYEAYPLLTDELTFTVKQTGEETTILHGIIPESLEIEIVDASIYLKEMVIDWDKEFDALAKSSGLQVSLTNKIDRINANIRKKGLKWVAGETSVSRLSYAEKKNLFGGRVPNLQGFEYYKGGIFTLPGALDTETTGASESPYVNEFSWRNRHGQNWLTPVKNQGSCGSCWAFAATAATELLVNLYYNQHLDLDLSEQDLLSCSGAGTCDGGTMHSAIEYIISSGIVDEGCFYYSATDLPCEAKCYNPNELIRIDSCSGRSQYFTIEEKKRQIIKGATGARVAYMNHCMALAGYKIFQEGDFVFSGNDVQGSWGAWIIVDANDYVCGKTAWLFKNSWGEDWGDGGYAYIVGGIEVLGVYGPVYSRNYTDSDIVCRDDDGDGYYTWGIGPKPANCPYCPDESDGDDSDGCIGPMDEFGNVDIISTTLPPNTRDTSVIYGEHIPDLTALGENLQWYETEELSNLIHSGNNLATSQTQPGAYIYYVTQTVSECESKPIAVELTIINPVPPPLAEDLSLSVCEPVPDLTAVGENITWYEAPSNTFIDSRDGQDYKAVGIGNQRWMAENINYFTPTGSWYYNNDSVSYAETYGRLYNWETAMNVCPSGWHLPSDEEWNEMELFIGNSGTEAEKGILEGGKLKESGTAHWGAPNNLATNEYGFTALPGGYFEPFEFYFINNNGYFWSSTEAWIVEGSAYCRELYKWYGSIGRFGYQQTRGLSVRCMKESHEILSTENSLTPVFREPGTYRYYVTQTINGIESYPDTVTLTINQTPLPSVSEHVVGCAGPRAPNLIASGENIRWYEDAGLSQMIHSGDTLKPEQTGIGTYTYYATQTIAGCESLPATVTLSLSSVPLPPTAHDTACCEGETLVFLVAEDENVTWYDDLDLINSIWSGKRFAVQRYPTETGENIFYLTQTVDHCQSPPDTIVYTIHPLPQSPVVDDVSICEGDSLPVLVANGKDIRWYRDSDSTFVDSRDGQEYRSVRIGNQDWMAENLNYYTSTGSSYYNNDSISYATVYGRLYSYDPVWDVCPSGWHLPSKSEWQELIEFLGGDSIAGGKLKETGYNHWISPNTDASNLSGFTALPAGYSWGNEFFGLGEEAHYWSTETGYQAFPSYKLTYNSPKLERLWITEDDMASVRCIKDKNYYYTGSGELLSMSDTQTGSYPFYVTQTISNCESPLDTVTFTINPVPAAPLTADLSICEVEEVPDFSATGKHIQWYADSELTSLLSSDNSFSTGQTQAGVYAYYVTQTELNCESPAESVKLQIHALPFVDLGMDTTIYMDQDITLAIKIPGYSYLWSDGSGLSSCRISGAEIGAGEHTWWVAVTDSNLCTYTDSIVITIIDPTNLEFTNVLNSIKIYPNPTNDLVIIEKNMLQSCSIKISSLKGQTMYSSEFEDPTCQIDLSSFQKGVYLITIRSKDLVITRKIVKIP